MSRNQGAAGSIDAKFERWLESAATRHLADLQFPEVTRALRALSAGYVERRGMLPGRSPFEGAGKRAAYALYYAPLHFMTVRLIVQSFGDELRTPTYLLDLGCGTGAAGAAWASAIEPTPRVTGLDAHPWAVAEAALTYRAFDLDADVRRGDLARLSLPRSVDGVIAGWVLNEVTDRVRGAVLDRLIDAAERGVAVLIVEPIATQVSPWWPHWADAFAEHGGSADEWRFAVSLPPLVAKLDRASGMRHDELTARSLSFPADYRASGDT